ncbi:hypothetical protein [Gemella sp. zg-1178]|nr:hypothetical protein [Gemella sp. zg-1178]
MKYYQHASIIFSIFTLAFGLLAIFVKDILKSNQNEKMEFP